MTDIAGETFNVLIEGDKNKEVLLLSNPMGTNLHFWDRQIPALAEHFRIVRYDSRGHGVSVANQGPYSVEGLGRDALAIMDALGIERAHWLGLSMGSIVGLWLLVHARERIGRAVLASTAAQIPGPDLWNSRIQSARESGMEGIASALAERWFTKHFRDTEPARVETVMEMVRTTPLHGYLAALAAVRDMDQREAIRSIRSKVLVIAGRHDPSTPPGMGALVASSIEGAKFVTLEASHMSNIEDETNFIKAAVEFLTAPEITAVTRPPRPRAPAKTAAAKNSRARKTAAKKAPAKKASGKKPGPRNSKQRCQRKRPPQKNQPQERSRRSGRHEKGHEKKDVRQEKKLNRERLARGAKVLMQNKPFSIILAAEGEVLLMQNNVIGGSSDRDDGGRGNLGKSRRHVGGDNMNSGRGTAHPVAKPRRIKALTWLGGYFHSLRRKGKAYAREIGLLGGKQ